MEFYPIALMENAILELKEEIKEVEKESTNSKYIEACRYINETRIVQLKSAIAFLKNNEHIPLIDL